MAKQREYLFRGHWMTIQNIAIWIRYSTRIETLRQWCDRLLEHRYKE